MNAFGSSHTLGTYQQVFIGADGLGLPAGALPFHGSTGVIAADSTNLSWDDTNNILSVANLAVLDGGTVTLGATTGTKIGAATDKLGFYNAAPIARRAGAAQAAVATTAATNSTPYGFAQAQADAIVTLLNELRAWAVAQGFIKGAA